MMLCEFLLFFFFFLFFWGEDIFPLIFGRKFILLSRLQVTYHCVKVAIVSLNCISASSVKACAISVTLFFVKNMNISAVIATTIELANNDH